jgi:peptide/nickel transport system permease protein
MSEQDGRSQQERRRWGRIRWRNVRWGEAIAIATLALLIAFAVWPQLFTSLDPLAVHPTDAFLSPRWGHPFGTDESGRDVFARVVYGTRQSLLIGITATALGMALAIVLGFASGLGGRWTDFAVTRAVEVLFAFPGLVLALLFVAVAGPGVWPATIAVGLATAPGYARIIRGQTRLVAGSGYVRQALLQGQGPWARLWRHSLPNTLWPVLALVTLGVGQAIVWAAALSYLGVGAVPPAAEWGAMLNAGRTYMDSAWWMTFFPGAAVVVSAAAATGLGRSLQQRTRQS